MITRRSFLRGSTTIVGFGAFAACRSVRRTPPRSPNEEVRVAVAGVRSRGNAHVRGYLGLPNVRVVAICDVDREVLARRAKEYESDGHPVDTHEDLREVLDRTDVDAVSIATPNHGHALQAIWACQAGKDVYLEKPVSHNPWEGARIVEAARVYERIVMTGTQCRSSSGIAEALAWVRDGGLGPIRLARGLCYKPRPSIGKVSGPQPVPSSMNYDLWCGPAPLDPLLRERLHYDWHWVFRTGNGDLGNQGIHQMDIARWALGEKDLAPRVMSVGGRFGYDDDGDTPNTQVVLLDYDRAPLLFEVRGLPRDRAAQQESWNAKGMDSYEGARIGVLVHCEQGTLRVPNYTSAIAVDPDGNELQRWEGASSHYAHFIDLVRSRRSEDSRADIREGHVSSALCHLGNISYRVGRSADPDGVRATLSDRSEAREAFDRLQTHLDANGVDLSRTPATLGPLLHFDPVTERFEDEDANRLLRRDDRAPFLVPEKV